MSKPCFERCGRRLAGSGERVEEALLQARVLGLVDLAVSVVEEEQQLLPRPRHRCGVAEHEPAGVSLGDSEEALGPSGASEGTVDCLRHGRAVDHVAEVRGREGRARAVPGEGDVDLLVGGSARGRVCDGGRTDARATGRRVGSFLTTASFVL